MPDPEPAKPTPNVDTATASSSELGDRPPTLSSKRFTPAPLPVLHAPLAPAQILDRLDKASRRGKLAGFRRSENPSHPFYIEVFGKYFDRRLVVEMTPAADRAQTTSTTLRFLNRVKHSRLYLFWFIILISVWPGVSLTDSILATYFDWYPREFWKTCAWYLPLTILPVPWMWNTAWRQSARVADAEAREAISKIATHLGATTEPRG